MDVDHSFYVHKSIPGENCQAPPEENLSQNFVTSCFYVATEVLMAAGWTFIVDVKITWGLGSDASSDARGWSHVRSRAFCSKKLLRKVQITATQLIVVFVLKVWKVI